MRMFTNAPDKRIVGRSTRKGRNALWSVAALTLCIALAVVVAGCPDDTAATYICANGTPVTGTPIGSSDVERCQSCASGYTLSGTAGADGTTCVKDSTAVYTCENGTPVDGTPSGTSNVEECKACNTGFTLSASQQCVADSGDGTAPTFTAPPAVKPGSIGATNVTVTLTASEAGTLFWVLYAGSDASPDSAAALIEDASDDSSKGVQRSGTSVAVDAAAEKMVTLSQLTPATTYNFYAVLQDSAGNIGEISAKLEITATAAPKPDFTVVVTADPTTPTFGQSVALSATVTNSGTTNAISTTLQWYRSTDATIDVGDATIDSVVTINALAAKAVHNTITLNVTAPSTAGTIYYGACVTAIAGEATAANNCHSAAVTVTTTPKPDLTVAAPTASSATVTRGATFTLTTIVTNGGAGAADGTTLQWYRSTDTTIGIDDTALGNPVAVAALAAGISSAALSSGAIGAPNTPGMYHYGACVAAVNDEANTENNCSARVTITVPTFYTCPGNGTAKGGTTGGATDAVVCARCNDGFRQMAPNGGVIGDDGTTCVANQYTCPANGIAKDGKPTGTADEVVCGSCNPGFKQMAPNGGVIGDDGTTCVATFYFCENGTAKSGSPAGNDDVAECDACNPGYTLNASKQCTDITAPTFAVHPAIKAGSIGATSVTVTLTASEVGKLVWVVYDNDTVVVNNAALLAAATAASQPADVVDRSVAAGVDVTAATAIEVAVTGLTAETEYDFYAVVQDSAGNTSDLSAKLDITTAAAPKADLTVTVTATDASVVAGGSVPLSATVTNRGAAAAAGTTLQWYRSSDAAIDVGDTPLGSAVAVAALAAGAKSGQLNTTATVPTTTGPIYYGACVTAISGEADAANNCHSVAITVTDTPKADLTVALPIASSLTVSRGATFTLTTNVANTGTAAAVATTLQWYRSLDTTIGVGDTTEGSPVTVVALNAGTTSTPLSSGNITAPAAPGVYHYGACVAAVTDEANTNNNCSPSITITVPPIYTCNNGTAKTDTPAGNADVEGCSSCASGYHLTGADVCSQFTLTSSASDDGFNPGGIIPSQFKHNLGAQCSGSNNFPKIAWSGVPKGTKSFVLIVDDPSGGNWVHLNLYNIHASATSIPKLSGSNAAITSFGTLGGSAPALGQNDWNNRAWEGPCPPSGNHTYYFKLYAITDTTITNSALINQKTRSEFESGYGGGTTCGRAQSSTNDKILACVEISGTRS